MLYFASLNSGSNGNCYYAGNATEAVLIDAGISCRETEKRLKRLQLEVGKIKAIFISHEHTDHIKGVTVLAKKYALPVYISERTARAARVDCKLMVSFNAHEAIRIGNISVTAFPKSHDAADPYSFVVSSEETTVGVFTDIGLPCKNVLRYFSTCDAAILEANYDEEMLSSGSYPFHLKQRIRSSKGHLSNDQALEIVEKYRSPKLTHLMLAHLSKNNNCPEKVADLFQRHYSGIEVVVASREGESAVYRAGKPQVRQLTLAEWL